MNLEKFGKIRKNTVLLWLIIDEEEKNKLKKKEPSVAIVIDEW
jgi:hypothetical protein